VKIKNIDHYQDGNVDIDSIIQQHYRNPEQIFLEIKNNQDYEMMAIAARNNIRYQHQINKNKKIFLKALIKSYILRSTK
jgi:hypothetical protein